MCGPTVYDSSHMGHARTYLSFDIIKRILEDYFGYNVFLVMNVTDIDDKIILKARQNALFADFRKLHANAPLAAAVKADLELALQADVAKHSATLAKLAADTALSAQERTSTIAMFDAKLAAARALLADVEQAPLGAPAAPLIDAAAGALAPLLDARLGTTVDIQTAYREHAAKYEKEYVEDMAQLGIRAPDVMTRVSEYLPEVVGMVERIVANGFAYEADGSVYFDTQSFGKGGHSYGKLAPWSVGDAQLLAEGEGALGGAGGKRHPNDFALWKKSKPGEPKWPSPWGDGRPGWHIECSAMAASVIDGPMDLHSGGMDLKFPHHDNELAQAEAYYPCQQWVNYFLHTGHLHIEGLKMSKSLKNFVTIRQALERNTGRQLRLLFLFRAWDAVMNYSNDMMEEVRGKEKTFAEFFLLVKQVGRDQADVHKAPQRWSPLEIALNAKLAEIEATVDDALKDNFDTPRAMTALLDLITATNIYARQASRRALLINKCAGFVERMLRVFGVIGDGQRSYLDADGGAGSSASSSSASSASSAAAAVEPIVDVLAKFRYSVRTAALANKSTSGALGAHVLTACDQLRNDALPPLGVRLEDDPNFPAAFKIVDAAELMREISEKRASEAAARLKKLTARIAATTADLERAEAAAVDPATIFRAKTDEFGSFDDAGLPLTDAKGAPLEKNVAKRVAKDHAAAKKANETWLKKGGATYTEQLRQSLAEDQKELAAAQQQ
jgi:cysteinyl-tRNA synthetase